MVEKPIEIRLWLIGLACLVAVLVLAGILQVSSVFGLAAHQTATTAAQITEIQQAWAQEGNLPLVWALMVADLVFIGVFGVGAIIAGRGIVRAGGAVMAALGVLAVLSGIAFILLDYCETILEVVQLARGEGDSALVAIVSSLTGAKLAALGASFAGVALALVWRRFGKVAR